MALQIDESSGCDKVSEEKAATKVQAASRGFLVLIYFFNGFYELLDNIFIFLKNFVFPSGAKGISGIERYCKVASTDTGSSRTEASCCDPLRNACSRKGTSYCPWENC